MDSLLIFDIKGIFAHFRAFYTNSSSLSYGVPPRTVVTGIVAGILGLERDSYYEDFGCEKCKVALSLRTLFRKVMQTVNYVNTAEGKGGEKAVNLSGGRTQIPLEILLPPVGVDFLIYRVYFYHPQYQEELKNLLMNGKSRFPPYLGLTEFSGKVDFVDFIGIDSISIKNCEGEETEIQSVLPTSKLMDGGLRLEEGKQYIKELMPVDFNARREARTANFFYERKGQPVKARIKGEYLQIVYKDAFRDEKIRENIVFME